MPELDPFTRAYVRCALWSTNDESTPQGGDPLDDNYDATDIDPATLERMASDCRMFQEANAAAIAQGHGGVDDDGPFTTEERAGHDFWLTRNRHGAGFWDGDWPDTVAKQLTDAAKRYGEVNLYVGDDGMIYD